MPPEVSAPFCEALPVLHLLERHVASVELAVADVVLEAPAEYAVSAVIMFRHRVGHLTSYCRK
jgi:hypothetical protein